MNELTIPSLRELRTPIAARLVTLRLEQLRGGVLELEHRGRVMTFGREAEDGLRARIRVLDSEFFTRVLFGGSIAAGEAYVDGSWIADDLTRVLRIFARDASILGRLDSGASRWGLWLAGIYHRTRKNTIRGSRRNISEHYDLGNDFFELMLDPTMTYSAAVFERPSSTLKEASVHKLDLLCKRLALQPSDHLLEIGTGWGSLAMHAATRYGCRVTTTTISRRQRELALSRVREAGLEGRVTVLDHDYRTLEGRFEKIVSCEMIEAVGREYYGSFFAKCSSLLAPRGLLALQAITIRDQMFERAAREVDFIKRYIFPGSCIPSPTALLEAATREGDFGLKSFEDYTPHYARTMVEWRGNLAPHRNEVTARFGERFWRLWSYYLAYCEAGFEEGYIGSAQLLFEKTR